MHDRHVLCFAALLQLHFTQIMKSSTLGIKGIIIRTELEVIVTTVFTFLLCPVFMSTIALVLGNGAIAIATAFLVCTNF